MKYCIGCKKKYPDNYSHCPICREALLSFEEYLFYYQQLQWQQQQQQMQMYWQQTQRQQMQWQQQWQNMAQAQWQQMQQQQAQLQQIQQFQAQMMQYGLPQQEQRAIGAGNAMNQYGDSQYGYGYSNNGIQEAVYAPDMQNRVIDQYDDGIGQQSYYGGYQTENQYYPYVATNLNAVKPKKLRRSLGEILSEKVTSFRNSINEKTEAMKRMVSDAGNRVKYKVEHTVEQVKESANEKASSPKLSKDTVAMILAGVAVVACLGYFLSKSMNNSSSYISDGANDTYSDDGTYSENYDNYEDSYDYDDGYSDDYEEYVPEYESEPVQSDSVTEDTQNTDDTGANDQAVVEAVLASDVILNGQINTGCDVMTMLNYMFADIDVSVKYNDSNTVATVVFSGSFYPNPDVPQVTMPATLEYRVDLSSGKCSLWTDSRNIVAMFYSSYCY